ncbi:MAG: cation:proton antiporter [Bacteroidales bacterium]|nr:cation:proton antiporter [Bacteroidales bacterium]
MLTSLSLIFLSSLALGWLFSKLKIPALLGMILVGIILGPNILNLISPNLITISPDLRRMALVIILLRAGLALNINEIIKVGTSVLLLCFVPASFEIIGFILLGPTLMKISISEAALIGTIVAAVSPAVVVPKMLNLIERGYGINKSIPQMIMAAGSVDDVFVIVLFTIATGFVSNSTFSALQLAEIPVSIISGIALGIAVGIGLTIYFKKFHLRDSIKVIILLSICFLLLALEDFAKNILPFSGLLAIMTMGATLLFKYKVLANRLSQKFLKLWIAAEMLLFVLVGAIVDINYLKSAGINAIALILFASIFRMAGVWVSLIKSNLNFKEKFFCMIAYSPKATVQAAIGSIPLALGLSCGNIALTIAVLSIIITAPLGAFGIDYLYKKLLVGEAQQEV